MRCVMHLLDFDAARTSKAIKISTVKPCETIVGVIHFHALISYAKKKCNK